MPAIYPGRPEGLEFQRKAKLSGRNVKPVDRPCPHGPSAHIAKRNGLRGTRKTYTLQANMISMNAALRGTCKQNPSLRERVLSTPQKPPRA
jgi:hypothetical protein